MSNIGQGSAHSTCCPTGLTTQNYQLFLQYDNNICTIQLAMAIISQQQDIVENVSCTPLTSV